MRGYGFRFGLLGKYMLQSDQILLQPLDIVLLFVEVPNTIQTDFDSEAFQVPAELPVDILDLFSNLVGFTEDLFCGLHLKTQEFLQARDLLPENPAQSQMMLQLELQFLELFFRHFRNPRNQGDIEIAYSLPVYTHKIRSLTDRGNNHADESRG